MRARASLRAIAVVEVDVAPLPAISEAQISAVEPRMIIDALLSKP
jgi:hypothetical protein